MPLIKMNLLKSMLLFRSTNGVYPESLPNYISIIAGYPYLTKDKDPGNMAPLKEQTIVNLLQSKNLT